MERNIVGLLFCDVAGYSKLTEPQLRVFVERVLPEVAALVEDHRDQLMELNTWGDALVAISADPYVLAHLALALRDFYKNRNWIDDHLPENLSCRTALHSGVVFTGHDPIRRTDGIVGTQVNLAARIEPVTTPGEVWVTEQFMKLIDPQADPTLAFDDLGDRPLAKKFGSARLYRLRRAHEPETGPPDVRVQPVEGPVRSKELEIVIHMAKHGTEKQRLVGLDMLGQFDSSESIATLLEVARDKSAPHRLRRMALASLHELKSKTAVPDLIAIAEDKDELPDIVGWAIQGLGEIRDVRALPYIQTALLGDRLLEVKAIRAAIIAIGKIGDPGGVPILREMFDQIDRFRPVLGPVMAACAVLPDPSFVAPLQAIASDRDAYSPDLRQTAIRALILNTPSQSEELFIELAQDESENYDVRFTAVGALAAVPSSRSKTILEELASDLSNPLAPRALVVMIKGSSLLEEQKEQLTRAAMGES